ncbi:molybdenum cofactor guanylyltransferase [Streptomyces sulfonofaciens]|uniref:Molybdenum cofactor guanylyltransferase n=1 Tax=Streptomyces sulfonofaciens TaxID=68272 RepID=A0A919KRF9_9ACTN|nr:molybdenum cofactor guanylyltransferase [Streptomyces sulfonofaciens]
MADGGGAPGAGPAVRQAGHAGAAGRGSVFDAVVLAGGAARRLGGADKPGVSVGGRSLLDRVLAACAAAGTTVVVGGRRPTSRPVVWALEEPRGGGPLAALHAGLRRTTAERVVVLSADLPFLAEQTVRGLLAALGAPGQDARPDTPERDVGSDTPGQDAGSGTSGAHPVHGPEGAVLVDAEGREQPLVGAYLSEPLQREIALLAAEHGGLAGLPLRLLTAELTLTRMSDPVASFDCDTWDDIATARSRIREHGHVLDEWMTAVKDELGLDLDVDTGVLLDLTRDVAHGVARPAAPLTSFLVGYAAAQNGGGREAVAEAARKAAALAARWEAEDRPGKPDAG